MKIVAYVICKKIFYVVRNKGEYYTLWVTDSVPDKEQLDDVPAFISDHINEGWSIAGNEADIIRILWETELADNSSSYYNTCDLIQRLIPQKHNLMEYYIRVNNIPEFGQAKYFKYVDADGSPVSSQTAIEIAPVITWADLPDHGVWVELGIFKVMPVGWKKVDGSLMAPDGYCWVNNGKSFFDCERQTALLKIAAEKNNNQ